MENLGQVGRIPANSLFRRYPMPVILYPFFPALPKISLYNVTGHTRSIGYDGSRIQHVPP